jgi:hypothetical protein
MKLTIIPSDGAVYEDGLCYSSLTWDGTPLNVHALQWQDVSGWIEYNDGNPNETITVLPQWANNAMDAWQVAYDTAHNPPTPPPPTAEENKQTAINYLQATDWTAPDDIANPAKCNPYLANQAEFLVYRNSVRQYAIYPVSGNIDWPILPTENWVKV